MKEEQQKEFDTFERVTRDWHATNKKWSEGHSHRVLKSLEDNIFAAIGKRVCTRSVNGIDGDIKLNKALWVMTEKMYECFSRGDKV